VVSQHQHHSHSPFLFKVCVGIQALRYIDHPHPKPYKYSHVLFVLSLGFRTARVLPASSSPLSHHLHALSSSPCSFIISMLFHHLHALSSSSCPIPPNSLSLVSLGFLSMSCISYVLPTSSFSTHFTHSKCLTPPHPCLISHISRGQLIPQLVPNTLFHSNMVWHAIGSI
jgi:hypothetical protein